MSACKLTIVCLAIIYCFFFLQSCKYQHKVSEDTTITTIEDTHGRKENNGHWNNQIPDCHQWREISPEEYYFNVPTEEQVAKWKAICEEWNQWDSSDDITYDLGQFIDVNHYITVHDFVEVWYRGEFLDDDFTTWRLQQYDSLSFVEGGTEYDKFHSLKNAIEGLLSFQPASQWEMNFKASLYSDFQEYYDRMLYKAVVSHSDGAVALVLKREEEAWLKYHDALISAFKVIDGSPTGWVGSGWPMAIGDIAYDDAQMRAMSLEDFYFAMVDGNYRISRGLNMIGQNQVEMHISVSESDIIEEYQRFIEYYEDEYFYDSEYNYPLSEIRKALNNEMRAWEEWMKYRKLASSFITNPTQYLYNNATNNVRRHKLIMLKNRYQGYGLTSPDILDIILSYDCDNCVIQHYCFEEEYRSITN